MPPGAHEHHGSAGPEGARNLNKLSPYANGTANQLMCWSKRGVLTGAPNDPTTAPRTAVFDDPNTGTLEERARGYLDVNCGHCHNETGAAGSYRACTSRCTRPIPSHLGVCKSPVAAGQGSGGLHFDVAPGDPDQSIITFRMASIAPGVAMPELGRQRVHSEALQVICDWIASIDGSCTVPQ